MTTTYFAALGVILLIGVAGWLLSLVLRQVSFVDSLWSLFFLVAALVYAADLEVPGLRATVVIVLTAVWALRLSLHITIRNWGEGEDARYQAIRENNEPNFAFKSLYIVFGLQGVLAWIISLPLLFAISSDSPPGLIDSVALVLWLIGFVFEAGGDYQLARFRSNPENKGKVLNTGLWRFTRHPNYFGDACVWWAFYLFALSAGAWWTIFAPALMTFLLLRVSGVRMLEEDIGERRPDYAAYIASTNAFLPGRPRNINDIESEARS